MSQPPILSLNDVKKAYRSGWINKKTLFQLSVNESFPEPSIIGVMGPNGAGKTTLFEMIAGANRPSSGNILINGMDIQSVKYKKRDRLVIHYHQSYQIREFEKRLPSIFLKNTSNKYPVVHLFDEPQFSTQDGYVGFMLQFFHKLRDDRRLVFICLHPTAGFHLDILKEICDKFMFVNNGGVANFPTFDAMLQNADVRSYLGDIINQADQPVAG